MIRVLVLGVFLIAGPFWLAALLASIHQSNQNEPRQQGGWE